MCSPGSPSAAMVEYWVCVGVISRERKLLQSGGTRQSLVRVEVRYGRNRTSFLGSDRLPGFRPAGGPFLFGSLFPPSLLPPAPFHLDQTGSAIGIRVHRGPVPFRASWRPCRGQFLWRCPASWQVQHRAAGLVALAGRWLLGRSICSICRTTSAVILHMASIRFPCTAGGTASLSGACRYPIGVACGCPAPGVRGSQLLVFITGADCCLHDGGGYPDQVLLKPKNA